jgi:hypothetical protein
MRIRITKEHGGNRLICTRRDGSHTQGPIGPSLPYHDLAHYVVERELRMSEGFYGQIASGRSIEELNDPAVIRSLPPQVWEAEVITRTLQGLGNGAVEQSEFRASVEAELQRVPHGITDGTGTRMLNTYIHLLNTWEQVAEGAALELHW